MSVLHSLTVESVGFFPRLLQPRQERFSLASINVRSGFDWRVWKPEVISSARSREPLHRRHRRERGCRRVFQRRRSHFVKRD